MSATPATLFSDQMTFLTGNVGGAVQVLPQVNLVSGKVRSFISRIVLAAQTSGSIFGVARIPLFASFLGIFAVTDTSLGSSTLKFGDAGNGNSAIYGAAAVLTSTDTEQAYLKTAVYGVPITSGFDCVTGLATSYTSSSGFGAVYEDVIMTTGAATLPGSGNLVIVTRYMID